MLLRATLTAAAMKRAAVAVLVGVALLGAAPTAHADQASIDAAVHDSWESNLQPIAPRTHW